MSRFVARRRLALITNRKLSTSPSPPTCAVEVLSPNDRDDEVEEKVQLWLAAGSQVVWVVDPEARTVVVHRLGAEPVTLREDQEIDGGEVIPGFRCRVADFSRLRHGPTNRCTSSINRRCSSSPAAPGGSRRSCRSRTCPTGRSPRSSPRRIDPPRRPPLPELGELDVVRHYTNLSTLNMSIDRKFLSARLVHDEVQPEAERAAGGAAGVRVAASLPGREHLPRAAGAAVRAPGDARRDRGLARRQPAAGGRGPGRADRAAGGRRPISATAASVGRRS